MASKTRSMKASEKKLLDKAESKKRPSIAEIVETEERIPHITEFEDVVDILPELAERHRAITDAEAELKKQKAELSAEIDALMDAIGQRTVRGDTWAIVKVAGAVQEKIVPEKLLMQGVTLEQIDAATERRQNAGYIQVRRLKGTEAD